MQPGNSHQRWFAAAVCVLATAGYAAAEEGVVRLSDSSQRAGVVRLNPGRKSVVQAVPQAKKEKLGPAYFAPNVGYGQFGYPTSQVGYQRPGFEVPPNGYPGAPTPSYPGAAQPANPYRNISHSAPYSPQSFGYAGQGVAAGGCGLEGYGCGDYGGCGDEYGVCPDDGCGEGCGFDEGCCDTGRGGRGGRSGRRGRRGGQNGCDNYCYGDGYNKRMVTLFAQPTPDDGCSSLGSRWWRGQQENYLARNQRLSNTLFGWMVPSGCCGQGCPPVGKYHMIYADDPGYVDDRDNGQLYGAQGYGTHLSVPLAPNVRHSYNYSWGTPSSRITPMGQYSPGTAMAQPSAYQSW